MCVSTYFCYISVSFFFLFLFFSTMNRFRSTALLWRLFFSRKIWIHISWKCFTSSHLFVLKNLFLNSQNYWTFWVTGYIVEVMELRWFGLLWNKLVVWQQLNYCLQVSDNTYQYYLHLNGDITISWVRLYSTTMFTCIIYALLLWDRWQKEIINIIFVPQTFNLFLVN